MRPELEMVCGDILRKQLCQDHSTVAGCSGAGVSSHCKTKPRDRCDSAWTSLSPAQVLAGKGRYLGRQCHTWGQRSHEQGRTKTAPRVAPCPSRRECPVQHEWPRPPAHHGLDTQDMSATRTHQSFHSGLRAAGASSRCGCGRVQCKEARHTLLLSVTVQGFATHCHTPYGLQQCLSFPGRLWPRKLLKEEPSCHPLG